MIFGIASIQGLVLAFILFFNKRGRTLLNLILGFLVFFFSVILIEESLEFLKFNESWRRITGFSFLVDLFLGPLSLIYARSLSGKEKIAKKHLYHLTVPVILNLFYIPYHFFVSWDVHLINNPSFENIFLGLVFLKIGYQIVYQVYAIRVLHQFILKSNHDNGNMPGIKMARFVRNVLMVVLILIPGVIILEVGQGLISYDSDFVTSLIMMFGIYSIGYAALMNPVVYPRFSDEQQSNGSRYQTSSLTDMEKEHSIAELKQYMDEHKPFLNPELTSDQLAKMIELSRHHLSQILNESLGLKFYDFVNQYRVNEFLKLLENSSEKNILEIGLMAGFNSKATLNRAFKKVMGYTPSDYLKKKS